MATEYLTDAELAILDQWPGDVTRSDLVSFFELTDEQIRWVRSHRGDDNQLAFGVRVGALQFFGFIPELADTPAVVVEFVADLLDVSADHWTEYLSTSSRRSRQQHNAETVEALGWSTMNAGQWKILGDWLVDRALEHDTPMVLFRQSLTHLRHQEIVRPGLDRLMRAVATARETAISELHRMVRPLLTSGVIEALDKLIETDPELRVAPIVWLSSGATASSAVAIKTEIAKLGYIEHILGDRVDVTMIGADRRRQFAQIARRQTPAALRRMSAERRQPMLLAFLVECRADLIDQLVLMFDQALGTIENRTRELVRERLLTAAQASRHRLALLDDILDVVLDSSLDDATVGHHVRGLGTNRLHHAARPDHERHQPDDDGHLDLIEDRYTHIRGFAPHVLAALDFRSSINPNPVLDAVQTLVELNDSGRRHVPDDVSTGIVPARWQSYVTERVRSTDPTGFRHHWELAVLYQLRNALRSGEIWVEGSRRYANPATYLIDTDTWQHQRPEALTETRRHDRFADQLASIDAETGRLLDELEPLLTQADSTISIDDEGKVRQKRLAAETVPAETKRRGKELGARLPSIPLAELLIEIGHLTGFTSHLTHANHGQPRNPEIEHRRNLMAAMLAQACNFGTTRMAELSGISPDVLSWTTRWYLRQDTLRAANNAIVNAHHQHPLAKIWGGGTLSSSDGLRIPIKTQSLTARRLTRYFTDQGGTSYTHVSDQHSTYGTQIIPSTDRDATYVLDEIIGNTSDLDIAEHTTDSHGQTLLTFALFDLVGLRLSPRIAKLTHKPLWRPHPKAHYRQWPTAGPLLAHPVNTTIIDQHWDDLLRIAWSIKSGHTSASLLIARLQAGARQHPLAKALIEYGKLQRTNHALRWFTDEAFRRRIGRQLNRGESLNALRRYIFFAQQAEISHRHHDDQTTQALCHTLVVNACVLWTTIYLQKVIDDEPEAVPDDVIAHLSPAQHDHINPYGTYNFNLDTIRQPPQRPLKPR